MENLESRNLWRDVLESIKVTVSPAIFSTWFSQTHISELNNTNDRAIVQIGCSSPYVKSTIESRYFGLIQDSLSKSLGKPCDLVFLVKANPQKPAKSTQELAPLFESGKKDEEPGVDLSKSRIRVGFTFDNFAVSSSNQMAYAAAEAVAERPGSSYNPLFIWGGVGVGKTHLANAIGFSIIEKEKDAKIFFCTGEDFTNDIVEGIRNKTTQVFRDKYRKLYALFVDDIQFIAGKDAVQEEFFHTFNAVTAAGGQIVLTSDRPPSEISKLEERLRSRFEAGLIVDIGNPDFELRCAIVQIKTKERGIELPMDMVQLVAANLNTAREIQGFLIKLTAETKFKKTEVTQEIIQSLLGKGSTENTQANKAKPEDVISAVSTYYAIGKRNLLGISRARPVARPRQALMYLLRTHLGLPFEEVGRLVGGRDHTTVMHAVEKITQLASTDVQIREDLLGIKNKL